MTANLDDMNNISRIKSVLQCATLQLIAMVLQGTKLQLIAMVLHYKYHAATHGHGKQLANNK